MGTIIINADDFGSRASVNRAIAELFDNKIINSTSLMANMPGFEEAIDIAHAKNLTKKIGVHLVLNAGDPLTKEIRAYSFLFNEEANRDRGYLKKLVLMDKNLSGIIFKECCAQIDKIKKKGLAITHLDTHGQIHDMCGITRILIELLKTYSIPSMRILNNLDQTKYYKNVYRNAINLYLRRKKVNFSDYLGNRNDFLSAIAYAPTSLYNSTIEIMVHPDYNDKGEVIDRCKLKEYDFNILNGLSENFNADLDFSY